MTQTLGPWPEHSKALAPILIKHLRIRSTRTHTGTKTQGGKRWKLKSFIKTRLNNEWISFTKVSNAVLDTLGIYPVFGDRKPQLSGMKGTFGWTLTFRGLLKKKRLAKAEWSRESNVLEAGSREDEGGGKESWCRDKAHGWSVMEDNPDFLWQEAALTHSQTCRALSRSQSVSWGS